MAITIHIPKPFTRARYLDSMEHPGRPSRSIAGSWISDFVALGKAIMLCPFCVHKFHPRSHQYEVWRNEWYSIAKCDDCKQLSRQIRTFIPQRYHAELGDFTQRPKRGRWMDWKLISRWSHR